MVEGLAGVVLRPVSPELSKELVAAVIAIGLRRTEVREYRDPFLTSFQIWEPVPIGVPNFHSAQQSEGYPTWTSNHRGSRPG